MGQAGGEKEWDGFREDEDVSLRGQCLSTTSKNETLAHEREQTEQRGCRVQKPCGDVECLEGQPRGQWGMSRNDNGGR